jgi:hypothetical protein
MTIYISSTAGSVAPETGLSALKVQLCESSDVSYPGAIDLSWVCGHTIGKQSAFTGLIVNNGYAAEILYLTFGTDLAPPQDAADTVRKIEAAVLPYL